MKGAFRESLRNPSRVASTNTSNLAPKGSRLAGAKLAQRITLQDLPYGARRVKPAAQTEAVRTDRPNQVGLHASGPALQPKGLNWQCTSFS